MNLQLTRISGFAITVTTVQNTVRGVQGPGDVLGVMRQKVIKENAVPAFMGNVVTDPKKTLVALAIPFVLFLAVLGLTGHLGIPEGDKIVYSKFFPISFIEIIFISAVALTGISYLISLNGFWTKMSKQNGLSYSKGICSGPRGDSSRDFYPQEI